MNLEKQHFKEEFYTSIVGHSVVKRRDNTIGKEEVGPGGTPEVPSISVWHL